MSSGFNILTDDEVNGFNAVIELYGFSVEDFEIAEIWEAAGNEDDKLMKNYIQVIRKSSGIEAEYAVVYKSMWPTEFEDDLKHGAFGQIDV